MITIGNLLTNESNVSFTGKFELNTGFGIIQINTSNVKITCQASNSGPSCVLHVTEANSTVNFASITSNSQTTFTPSTISSTTLETTVPHSFDKTITQNKW